MKCSLTFCLLIFCYCFNLTETYGQVCEVKTSVINQVPFINSERLKTIQQHTITPIVDTINKKAYIFFNTNRVDNKGIDKEGFIIECRDLNTHAVIWSKLYEDTRDSVNLRVSSVNLNNFQHLLITTVSNKFENIIIGAFLNKEIQVIILNSNGQLLLSQGFLKSARYTSSPSSQKADIISLDNGNYVLCIDQFRQSGMQNPWKHLLYLDNQLNILNNAYYEISEDKSSYQFSLDISSHNNKVIFINSLSYRQFLDSSRGGYYLSFEWDPIANLFSHPVRHFQPLETRLFSLLGYPVSLSRSAPSFKVNDSILVLPDIFRVNKEIVNFGIFNLRRNKFEKSILLKRVLEANTFIHNMFCSNNKILIAAELSYKEGESSYNIDHSSMVEKYLIFNLTNGNVEIENEHQKPIMENIRTQSSFLSYSETNFTVTRLPINDTYNIDQNLEFHTFSQSVVIPNNCFSLVSSTEFYTSQRSNFSVTPAPFTVEKKDTNTINETQSYLQVQDVTYSLDTLCYETISCTTPIIQGLQKICDTVHSYSYAYIANSCKGKYTWLLPEEAILQSGSNAGQEQINIKWKRTGTFMIYLKPNWCINPADSLLVVVAPFTHQKFENSSKVLCTGETYMLTAPTGLFNLRWNTGEQTMNKIVQASGAYWYTGSDACGHWFSDTIVIERDENDYRFFSTIEICRGYDSLLAAPIGPLKYKWTGPNTNVSDTLSNLLITIDNTSEFDVWMTDNTGCIQRGTYRILGMDCISNVFVPTAFTPNQDGLNDVFRPIIQGRVEYYRFEIRNRWGQRIFTSSQPDGGWNGTINGQPQLSGQYVWQLVIKFRNETEKSMSGKVKLVR